MVVPRPQSPGTPTGLCAYKSHDFVYVYFCMMQYPGANTLYIQTVQSFYTRSTGFVRIHMS